MALFMIMRRLIHPRPNVGLLCAVLLLVVFDAGTKAYGQGDRVETVAYCDLTSQPENTPGKR